MKNKLTKTAIGLLIHARKTGAAAPFPGANAGGAIRRLAVRLAREGLLEKVGPFEITKAGEAAIENYDNYGRKMSRFYLSAYEAPIAEKRMAVLNGVELQALVRTSGDTVGVAAFKMDGSIELWRKNKLIDASARSIADLYRIVERLGRNW